MAILLSAAVLLVLVCASLVCSLTFSPSLPSSFFCTCLHARVCTCACTYVRDHAHQMAISDLTVWHMARALVQTGGTQSHRVVSVRSARTHLAFRSFAVNLFLMAILPLTSSTMHSNALPLIEHRRALQTFVSDVTGLTNALSDASVGRITIAAGHYALTAELIVTRSVVIEAAQVGSVVLDAQASSASQRRVLAVQPGASDVVTLTGLNITGGYTRSYVGGGGKHGGAVYIASGIVQFIQTNIYSNTAERGEGGGVGVVGGHVSFYFCNMFNNEAGGYSGGGSVYVESGQVRFRSCHIYSNEATYDLGVGWGGGITIAGGQVTFETCNLHNNRAV